MGNLLDSICVFIQVPASISLEWGVFRRFWALVSVLETFGRFGHFRKSLMESRNTPVVLEQCWDF